MERREERVERSWKQRDKRKEERKAGRVVGCGKRGADKAGEKEEK